MSAEQLMALEAALGDLSTLYVAARQFTAIRERAETELLVGINMLASKLRRLLRAAELTDDAIALVSREILATAAHWHLQLEGVHTSATYQRTLAALAADDQTQLAALVPDIFAGLSVVHPSPSLYFPVSPASARRRGTSPGGTGSTGTRPFLSPRECAEKIQQLVVQGILPETGGSEWWERELAAIVGTDTPAALETPLALRLDAATVRVAVFGSPEEPSLRVFTPCLRAPFSIVVARSAPDEWWAAYEESYAAFRDALQRELATRGHRVSIWEAGS